MSEQREPLIGARLSSLETSVKHLAEMFERHLHTAEKERNLILQKLEESRKPQYSFIIAIITVVLSIGGACFGLLSRENLHTRTLSTTAELRSEKRIDQLDVKLQMEQRLLNDTISTRMNTLNESAKLEHDDLRDEIRREREWRDFWVKRELNSSPVHRTE